MTVYTLLSHWFPVRRRPAPAHPRRIVFIKPCCIGDVMMATAALKALRQGYPNAHITWAVGRWSRPAIEGHDGLDAILDTGAAANPAGSVPGLVGFAQQLRDGHFDLAVSVVRSPWVSVATWLAGIPHRAGLDSAGRGFAYTIRAPLDPQAVRHEAEIYLDVIAALGLSTAGYHVNTPVHDADTQNIQKRLSDQGITGDYIVINPTGGSNPGMQMHSKRWPPHNVAQLADRLTATFNWPILLIGGPKDGPIIEAVQSQLQTPATVFSGELSFGEIAALACGSRAYIGNDTGLTHLAAGTGAPTVMIFGPSDPARYAPYTHRSIALWKPTQLSAAGVVAGTPQDWEWSRDGISVDEVFERVSDFITAQM